jgi:hypothetical protein
MGSLSSLSTAGAGAGAAHVCSGPVAAVCAVGHSSSFLRHAKRIESRHVGSRQSLKIVHSALLCACRAQAACSLGDSSTAECMIIQDHRRVCSGAIAERVEPRSRI